MRTISTAFFGSALDVLDQEEKIFVKQAYLTACERGLIQGPDYRDPYQGFVEQKLLPEGVLLAGSAPVPSWLTCKPELSDYPKISQSSYQQFLEDNGCLSLGHDIKNFVINRIFPNRPALIGVDHSQTAGVILALGERYNPEDLGLIILDAHQDAIEEQFYHMLFQSKVNGSEGKKLLDKNGCSFQCGNFVKYLVDQGQIKAENIIFIGLNDLPESLNPEDPNMAQFMTAYKGLQNQGAKLISKDEIINQSGTLTAALKKLKTPYFYVSTDVDVGSLASIHAARFMHQIGVDEGAIYFILDSLESWATQAGSHCVGFDLMEMDIHLADNPWDKTFKIGANILSRLTNIG